MIKIFIAFLPWAIFWSSAYAGDYKSGALWGLALSGTLCLIHIKKLKTLEVTTFCFFLFVLFFLQFEALLITLSYAWLAAMSFLPLLFKKPSFTLSYIAESYPPAYAKDKVFVTVNNIIAGVWGIVFLGCAASVGMGYLALPGILITSGTVFSVLFPLKAPAYFALKEFKKYDWQIRVNIQKDKKENEYDVIIIGSGIGGLTCGSLLSKKGYKVLVLEQHSQTGGYCSSFARKDFVFNSGVENISGLWERGPIAYLLNELELKKDVLFIKNTERYIFKGREIDVPNNVAEYAKLLSDIFPDEGKNIVAFFKDAETAYTECYKDIPFGVPLPDYLIAKVLGAKKLADYPKEHPYHSDWLNKTYQEKLDGYFKNEDIKRLLSALMGNIGTDPKDMLAASVLGPVIGFYLYGGYFTRGGAQKFADALAEYIKNHNGEILLKHRADKILVEDKKVYGVKAGSNIFKATIVVSNVNARTTFLELLERNSINKKFVKYIENLKMSPSCFMVFLGVDLNLANYPILIKDLNEEFGIVISSNADPGLAPEGKASVSLITLANYSDFPKRGTEEYSRKKEEIAAEIIRKAERIIPNLRGRIVVQAVATPKTFERYTLMPEGALYSFDQSVGIKRPYFKTPVKGLYLAGASTFPGGGIEAVVISGTITTWDICRWKVPDWRISRKRKIVDRFDRLAGKTMEELS